MKELINLVPIAPYVKTNYHIQELISLLDILQAEIFKKQRSPVEIIDKDVPFPLSEAIKKLAMQHEYDLANSSQADMFLEKLRDGIKKLPLLTITMGFSPTLELITDINTWVATNVTGFVALDFVEDRSLIAGAVIRYNGKTRDYSVKKYTTDLSKTVQNTELSVKSNS